MQIEIIVREKIARTVDKHAFAVCGNSDYTVKFNFDSEWDSYETKTARFKYNGSYTDVPFSGDTCPMPVVANAYRVEIGVYAGELHTSSPALLPLRRSILDGEETESEPSQEIKDNLDKMLAGKIAAPQVAKVGEVLTVEAVDAEGKPTKWKAAPGVDITTELTQESTDAQVPSAKAAYDAMQDATDKEAVRFVAQELTDTQKQQARVNIGTYEWRYCISKSELTQKLNSWGDVGSINRHYSVPEDEFGDINLPALALSNGYMHGVNVYTIFDSVGKVWELVTGNSNRIKRRYNDIMVVTIKADDNGNLLGDIDPWTINWSATEDKMAIFANYQGCVFPLKSCTNKYAIFSATLENDAGEFVIRHVSVDANQLVKVYDIPVAPDTIPQPSTAQVGQIVKVKAVDDNGKITETEAVDMPSQKALKWVTVHSSDLTESKRELIISTDTDGKSIADYNPVGLSLIVSTPADATVESNNGAPWIYPSTTKFDNAIRVIGSISGWKTIARDSAFVFNGGSSAMSCTGNVNTSLPTYKLEGYALDGVRIFFNGTNDHLPVGTHVEVAILCEVEE